MPTQCIQESFRFHPLIRREVRGRFDGGAITSDAGGLVLRKVEKRTGIVGRFAACFREESAIIGYRLVLDPTTLMRDDDVSANSHS